jgi:hypothetical protein
VAALKPTSAGRCGLKLQLVWQHVDARPAPCLDLELVCGGTRSSGCRQWGRSIIDGVTFFILRIYRQTTTFWKGVVMVAKAVKLGYRWVPGNGKRILF